MRAFLKGMQIPFKNLLKYLKILLLNKWFEYLLLLLQNSAGGTLKRANTKQQS